MQPFAGLIFENRLFRRSRIVRVVHLGNVRSPSGIPHHRDQVYPCAPEADQVLNRLRGEQVGHVADPTGTSPRFAHLDDIMNSTAFHQEGILVCLLLVLTLSASALDKLKTETAGDTHENNTCVPAEARRTVETAFLEQVKSGFVPNPNSGECFCSFCCLRQATRTF